MKKHCSFIILSSVVLSLLLSGILHAERYIIFEDLVTLNAFESSFATDYQDPTYSGLDFTVRGIVASHDHEGSFKSFRIDFNADTTSYLSYQDIQNKELYALSSRGLKCKIKVVDYISYIKKDDPLFGPDYWFTTVKLKISVWSIE